MVLEAQDRRNPQRLFEPGNILNAGVFADEQGRQNCTGFRWSAASIAVVRHKRIIEIAHGRRVKNPTRSVKADCGYEQCLGGLPFLEFPLSKKDWSDHSPVQIFPQEAFYGCR